MRPLPGRAARALRPGARPPRRAAGRSSACPPAWAPPLSLLLHGAVLAALLGLLTPEAVHEPVRMTGIPLVWVGEGEGSTARRLAELPPPVASAPPEAPETPPVPPAPDAAPVPPLAQAAPAAGTEAPPAMEAGNLPLPTPDAPAPVTSPAPAAGLLPQPLDDLPLPPPPPSPPQRRPALPQPPAQAAPSPDPGRAKLALDASVGGMRLGAGSGGLPGESRGPGMPAAGCAEAIGLPPGGAGHHNAGFVGLRLRLSDNGRVVEAKVAVSSGFPALDDWARTRIKRCRFTPALRDGRPVWSSYNTSVYFDETD